MKIMTLMTLILLLVFQTAWANPAAKIISISGEVKVRRGIEENWQPAAVGMDLEDIDTILTLELGEILLDIGGQNTFRLGRNSVLDIGDLRQITEQELVLYLVSKKIDRIKPRKSKIPFRVGNVSVVHGLNMSGGKAAVKTDGTWWRKEMNGARAMYTQEYYPNAVVKLHKIQEKYSKTQDCGELHFYLGQTLEALHKPGQAVKAYQEVIKKCKAKSCHDSAAEQRVQAAKAAIKSLKQ